MVIRPYPRAENSEMLLRLASRSKLLLMMMGTAAGLLAVGASAAAHEPEKVPDEVLHRPSPAPDRVILTFAGDPRTMMGVTWRTDASVPHALAEIAPASAGPDFVKSLKRVEARTEPLTYAGGTAHFHSLVFEGLEPGTLYAYRVGDGANFSEFFQFRTEGAEAEPFTFLYFGDAQNEIKSLWSRVIRQAAIDASKSAFFVHAGDLVNRHTNDHEWGEWFGAGGWLNGMIPSIPTPGNHEYNRDEDGRPQLSPHWAKQFTLPTNGPESLAESAYYVDYQNARIISLNSNEQITEQAEWLESVLKDENRPLWTILTFHHPIYSASKGRDNAALREAWQPILDRYKVDLVLQGHDHSYARSGPRLYDNVPTGQQVRRDVAGTVYVVSVSGPKMYNLDEEPWMLRSAENTQLYQIIKVDGDRLDFQARTATGALYDAFVLRKLARGEAAEFLDMQPGTDERLVRPDRLITPPVPAGREAVVQPEVKP